MSNDKSIKYVDLAFSLLFHALFLFTALCGLYLIVISKTQEQVLHDQIRKNIEALVERMPNDGNFASAFSTLQSSFSDLSTKYYNAANAATEINNKRVRQMMIFTGITLVLLIVIPWLFIKFTCGKSFHWGHVILENAVFFSAIGVFELYFFKTVIFKYIPIVPSTFQEAFFDSVKRHFKVDTAEQLPDFSSLLKNLEQAKMSLNELKNQKM